MKPQIMLTIFKSKQIRQASLASCVMFVATTSIIALSSGLGSERTIVIEAESRWASIEFRGDTEAWPIGAAAICQPRALRDLSVPRGDGPCDARLFEEKRSETGFVEWGRGGKAEISVTNDGGLLIRILEARSHPQETRILLERADWQRVGALSWFGYITVGRSAESGELGVLLSGQFEIRELFKWFRTEGRGTEVIKSGDLRQGETVSLVDTRNSGGSGAPAPTTSFGHIFLSERDDTFRLVGLSSAGHPALSIGFHGAEKPAIIRPNWIDRVTTSPMLAALITVFAVLIAVTNFVTAWFLPKENGADQRSVL